MEDKQPACPPAFGNQLDIHKHRPAGKKNGERNGKWMRSVRRRHNALEGSTSIVSARELTSTASSSVIRRRKKKIEKEARTTDRLFLSPSYFRESMRIPPSGEGRDANNDDDRICESVARSRLLNPAGALETTRPRLVCLRASVRALAPSLSLSRSQ
ncbi:hypothetical protein PUN28_015412 [Cardiocondyla obscurior]|uniref:Uncharacterized protein n=1 Tax=Cardiocondyla obscurior TaxID=286306 RepID=A0AAW2EV97_9HYME